jgi:predicted DsbA family dithiol-disulfide isomerase
MPLDRVESVKKHMTSLAAGEGITMKFNGKTGNSRLSHQLLALAKADGLQMQGNVAEEIFRLLFEEAGDITDIDMLVTAGVNCGLDEARIRKSLVDEKAAMAVDKEVEKVRELGVRGVPKFFVQGGKDHVDGAGDVTDFFEIFMRIKEEEGTEGVSYPS